MKLLYLLNDAQIASGRMCTTVFSFEGSVGSSYGCLLVFWNISMEKGVSRT